MARRREVSSLTKHQREKHPSTERRLGTPSMIRRKGRHTTLGGRREAMSIDTGMNRRGKPLNPGGRLVVMIKVGKSGASMNRGEQHMWILREPKALLMRGFPTKQMQKLRDMNANTYGLRQMMAEPTFGSLRTRTKLLRERNKRGEVNHNIVYRHGQEPVRGRGESKRCVSRKHLLWFRKTSQTPCCLPQAMRGACHASEYTEAFSSFVSGKLMHQ